MINIPVNHLRDLEGSISKAIIEIQENRPGLALYRLTTLRNNLSTNLTKEELKNDKLRK